MSLALSGMVVGVRYKCRGDRRKLGGGGMLAEAEDDALLVQHHERLKDEFAAKVQAAQIDSDIRAFRERGKRRDSAERANETAHLRELLSDRGDRTA